MGLDGERMSNPWPIFEGQLATMTDEAGEVRRAAIVELGAPPLLVLVGAWFLDCTIDAVVGAAILTLAGLSAAFLFQLTIQLLDRAASWADTKPMPSKETSRYARLLEQLAANAAYAALVSAATAAAALTATVARSGLAERSTSAITLALLTHLAVVLLVVLVRTFLLTIARLRDARTGAHLDG